MRSRAIRPAGLAKPFPAPKLLAPRQRTRHNANRWRNWPCHGTFRPCENSVIKNEERRSSTSRCSVGNTDADLHVELEDRNTDRKQKERIGTRERELTRSYWQGEV